MVKWAIRNKPFILTSTLLIFIAGIFSLYQIPKYENPPITAPGVSVFIGYPGANPLEMEKLILNPLEEAIHEISSIKRIHSICKDNLVEIRIEFTHGVDVDDKFREIMDAYQSKTDELPSDIQFAHFIKWSVSDVNILQIAIEPVSGNPEDIREIAEDLKDRLERIEELKKVTITGLPEKKVYIFCDPELLQRYNLSYLQLMEILNKSNTSIPVGAIKIQSRRIQVETNAEISDPDDLKNLIVKTDGKTFLRLKDIATVRIGEDEDAPVTFTGGKRVVFVSMAQKENVNIFSARSKVGKILEEFQAKYHTVCNFQPVFDQSRIVSYRFYGFFGNLIQGLILVGLITILMIQFRASFIILMSIPLILLGSIFLLNLQGYGLDQVSIAGMIVALGMLVDNSIVVTENIERHLRLGKNRLQAVLDGTNEVILPMFSATVTTVLAFVPLLFLNTQVGDFIKTLPLVVISSLIFSYIIAVTLNPILSFHFLSANHSASRTFNRIIEDILNRYYTPLVHRILQRPLKYIGLGLIYTLLGIAFLFFIPVSFFPKAEIPYLMVQIRMPAGYSITATRNFALQFERKVRSTEGVVSTAVTIGQGNPRIYYNHLTPIADPTISEILVELKTFSPSEIGTIAQNLRKLSPDYSGPEIKVIEFTQGPPQDAPIEFRIFEDDLQKLEIITKSIFSIISSHPGIINIDIPLLRKKLTLNLEIDRDKCSLMGIPTDRIVLSSRAALEGMEVKPIRMKSGEEMPVVLQMASKDSISLSRWMKTPILSLANKQVPLEQLVKMNIFSTPTEIHHHQFQRVSVIRADVRREFHALEVVKELESRIRSHPELEGIPFSVGGERENQQEAFGKMYYSFAIAFALVILILVIQFRSYLQPLIIMTAIPVATIGAFFSLFLFRQTFSFMAFIGFTSLIGIVVNNSIILVDYINQLLSGSMNLDEAIIQASMTRLRPVLSTTLTTILGILPLAIFGGTLWRPMALVIMGGLISSTILVLLVVPSLYKIVYKAEKYLTNF